MSGERGCFSGALTIICNVRIVTDNPDFEAMVSIISKLEALKSKAITDITTLYDIKAQALEDPLAFVQRLQKHKEVCEAIRINVLQSASRGLY